MPIGTYSVGFELPGFKKLVHENVVIQAGFNAEINAKLELSTVEETVTVSGESPVVDTQVDARSAATSTRRRSQDIPSARDPWEILEQTPGMMMRRQNVGGNGSGQQPSFSAHGTNSQLWTMDGGTITDTSSNSSPTYYDFDSFEEITDQHRRRRRVAAVRRHHRQLDHQERQQQLQGHRPLLRRPTTSSSRRTSPTSCARQGAGAGNPMQNIKDFGVEVGGPIVAEQGLVLGRARAQRHQGRRPRLPRSIRAGDPNDRNNLRTDLTRLDDTEHQAATTSSTRSNKTTFF